MFVRRKAIVYILPEVRTLAEVFGMHDPASASPTVFASRTSAQDSPP